MSRYSQHLFVHETNLSCRVHEPLQQRGAPSLQTLWSSKAPIAVLHITQWSCCLWWWMCHMWGCAVMKDTWLSRGMAPPRYPHRSLKHLCCLMSALPRGVYWWLPLIPLPAKKHVRCTHPALRLCVCALSNTGLPSCPLTLVVTVTLDSKLVPVAKQPGLLSHKKPPDINAMP